MKNNKFFSFLTIIAVSFLLMGCPYKSAVPLSPANTKAPDNLIGTWEESGNPSVTVEISKADGNNLKIQKVSKNEGADPTIEDYTGHITEINGVNFLNLNTASADAEMPEYYIYKLGKEGEFKLKLIEVTENIREQFTSSDEMKKFFAANMNNSYFYGSEDLTYFKVK